MMMKRDLGLPDYGDMAMAGMACVVSSMPSYGYLQDVVSHEVPQAHVV
jgi:hypothetical protein